MQGSPHNTPFDYDINWRRVHFVSSTNNRTIERWKWRKGERMATQPIGTRLGPKRFQVLNPFHSLVSALYIYVSPSRSSSSMQVPVETCTLPTCPSAVDQSLKFEFTWTPGPRHWMLGLHANATRWVRKNRGRELRIMLGWPSITWICTTTSPVYVNLRLKE